MPDDPKITDEQPQGHRAGAWVVLLMGIAGLVLGVYQWHDSFKAAFAHTSGSFQTPDQIEAARIEAMKTKDTDGDGLTDYDETYIYHTSPYLKDSDSDGIDDKTEVEQGSDPNCPKGKDCLANQNQGAPPPTSASSTDATAQMQTDVANQIMNPTPDQIRALLIQNGMKAADLQGIDDATLLQMYQQSLQEVQTQSNASTSQ